MKAEAIKEYFIQNGKIQSTENMDIFGQITKPPIYEVIRVIHGVPLFLEEHLDRMFASAKIIEYDLERNEKEIREDIKNLILKNNIDKLNIKLLSTEIEGVGKVFLVYLIKSFYPPTIYYDEGIHTILFNYERKNPNAKVLFSSFRDEVSKEIEDQGAFEALLVDKSGYIPEGSRSNIFFVRGGKVYTASKSEVLLGITRKHIFDVCEKLDIEIIEESIHEDELKDLEGAFMSGTSVNVLPISTIGDLKINSVHSSIIKDISRLYMEEMDKYIYEHREEWK